MKLSFSFRPNHSDERKADFISATIYSFACFIGKRPKQAFNRSHVYFSFNTIRSTVSTGISTERASDLPLNDLSSTSSRFWVRLMR